MLKRLRVISRDIGVDKNMTYSPYTTEDFDWEVRGHLQSKGYLR